MSEHVLQVRAKTDKGKVPDGAFELHQDVDVAVRPGLVTGGGSEQSHARDAECLDVRVTGAEYLKDIVSTHSDCLQRTASPGLIISEASGSRKCQKRYDSVEHPFTGIRPTSGAAGAA